MEVVQVWVKVTPFFGSTYLPSMSPRIAFDLASRVPATLNATLLGARVCEGERNKVSGCFRGGRNWCRERARRARRWKWQ